MWKRDEKLNFSPFAASMCGVIISAQRAGLKVNALIRDIATATAMVSPNWV